MKKIIANYGKMIGTSFLCGLLSYPVIDAGIKTFVKREGLPGGEVFLLPLIVLLLVSGYQTAVFFTEDKAKRWYIKGFRQGKSKGIAEGMEMMNTLKKRYGRVS